MLGGERTKQQYNWHEKRALMNCAVKYIYKYITKTTKNVDDSLNYKKYQVTSWSNEQINK